jgi:hypothetical protein
VAISRDIGGTNVAESYAKALQEARELSLEAKRQESKARLSGRIVQDGRVPLSEVTHRVVRDPATREWAIGELVEEGKVHIEIEYTRGRPATVLVLTE